MKIRDGIMKSTKIFSDIRVCHFYLNYFANVFGFAKETYNSQDTHSCLQAINRVFERFSSDTNRQEEMLRELELACDENILPIENFDWVSNDERAAFWLWGYIKHSPDSKLGIYSSTNRNGHTFYDNLGLENSPSSHSARVDLIIKFFDELIYKSPSPPQYKNNILLSYKAKWQVIYNHPIPLKWLPDDEDAVRWVWESLQKHLKTISSIGGLFSPLSSNYLADWFMPLNHTERLLAIRATLDLWDDAPDSKRLFLLNINKAWNQKKLRQSRTDKKALNVYLKNETKKRLDMLADNYEVRISDMLEKLINEHYQSVFTKK